jgi:hypothetical protein
MAYEKLLKLRKINKTKSLSENVFFTIILQILTNYLQKLNRQLYGLFMQRLKE